MSRSGETRAIAPLRAEKQLSGIAGCMVSALVLANLATFGYSLSVSRSAKERGPVNVFRSERLPGRGSAGKPLHHFIRRAVSQVKCCWQGKKGSGVGMFFRVVMNTTFKGYNWRGTGYIWANGFVPLFEDFTNQIPALLGDLEGSMGRHLLESMVFTTIPPGGIEEGAADRTFAIRTRERKPLIQWVRCEKVEHNDGRGVPLG